MEQIKHNCKEDTLSHMSSMDITSSKKSRQNKEKLLNAQTAGQTEKQDLQIFK